MQNVEEFMSEPQVVPHDMSLADAAQRMERLHVGAVVVSVGDEPVGMVTDRDLMLAGILGDDESATVGDFTSKPLIVVPVTATLHQVVETMRAKKVKRVGVRASDNRLVGVISADDLWSEYGEAMGSLARTIQREFRVERGSNPGTQSMFGKE